MSYSNKDIVASVFEAVNTVIRAAEVAKKQTKQGYHSAWKNDTKRLTELALCKESSRPGQRSAVWAIQCFVYAKILCFSVENIRF